MNNAEVSLHYIAAKNFIYDDWTWPWRPEIHYYFSLEACKGAANAVLDSLATVVHELVHLAHIEWENTQDMALKEELLAHRVSTCLLLSAPGAKSYTLPAWVEDYDSEETMLPAMVEFFATDKASQAVDISFRASLLTSYRMYKYFGTREIKIKELTREKLHAFCRGES